MSRCWTQRSLALALVLSLGGPAAVHAADDAPSALEDLARWVEREPEDPDLAWAYITALEDQARASLAIERLRDFVARWPDRNPEAWFHLGRWLYTLGSYEAALQALEDAIVRGPPSGTAHLYRGLSLRALGREADSNRAFVVGAALQPELAPEIFLLRGMARLEAGDELQAAEFLERAVTLDPAGETGRRARFLLGEREQDFPSQKRVSFGVHTGVEIDTNVTLDSGQSLSAATNQSDSRLIWGASLQARVLEGETTHLSLGYIYGESAHEDLKNFDLQSHLIFASAVWEPNEWLLLQIDATASDLHLEDDRYLRSWGLRPTVFATFGERIGLSRLYAGMERTHYHEPPLFPSLEQGGVHYSVGLEHYVPIPQRPEAWASLGTQLSRFNSRASADVLGFEGAFDNLGMRTTLRLNLPLALGFKLEVHASYTAERFVNRNVIDHLTQTGRADHRRDRGRELGVRLTRPLLSNTKLELSWRGIRQYSNVATYDYNRQIMGVILRAEL